jgi:CO/xanthine dehydrogenase FAD-binding subunit
VRTTGYVRPDSLHELLDTVADLGPGCRIVAGGTDLMVAARAGKPLGFLVNVFRLPELSRLAISGKELLVGATVTAARLLHSPDVAAHAPLLRQAADHFASPLVRSRATVGGNLCNASPAADLALALVALDAQVEIASKTQCRSLPIEHFFVGPGRTSLAAGEVVTGVRIPLGEGRWGYPLPTDHQRCFPSSRVAAQPCVEGPISSLDTARAAPAREDGNHLSEAHGPNGRFERFMKSGTRPALTISTAAVATSLVLEDGVVRKARFAFGAVAPTPLRGLATEAAIEGKPLTPEVIAQAVRAAVGEVRPIDDARASAVYRRRLVAAFVRRALSEAAAPAR